MALMLYCDSIDLSEGMDITKSNNNTECSSCHYWFFSIMGSNFKKVFAMVVIIF